MEDFNLLDYTERVIKELDIKTGEEFILDIGPGDGSIMKRLLKEYPRLRFICVEPSEEMIGKIDEFVQENLDKEYYITIYQNYDFLKLCLDKSIPYIFDRVLMSNVLHYFENLEEVYNILKLILSFTKKSGKVVIGEECAPIQVFNGVGIYTEKKDIEAIDTIFRKKERGIDVSKVYATICMTYKELDIPYKIGYTKAPGLFIEDWLGEGNNLSEEEKEEIKDILREMDPEQKKRFGFQERDDQMIMDFHHIIITG
jgi:SAM-dependent methyltransferase